MWRSVWKNLASGKPSLKTRQPREKQIERLHERRIFVDLTENQAASPGSEVLVRPEDHHHIRNVLRLQQGAVITAVCRKTGREFEAVISAIRPEVRIKLIGVLPAKERTCPLRSVSVALLKGDRNDLACEQLTQFAVQRIIFWQAQRSVSKIKGAEEQGRKLTRWKRICEAAAKQSGQSCVPEIEFARDIERLIQLISSEHAPEDLHLFCSLLPAAREISSFPRKPGNVHLIIGPEGDFSPEEEGIMLKHGLMPLSLGYCRFRSETAAVAAAAMASLWWC